MTRRRAPDPDAGGRGDGSRPLGPRAQRLVEAAGATDREERFRTRLAAIREQRTRRRRRARVLLLSAGIAATCFGILTGVVIWGLGGAAVALAVAAAVGGVWHLLGRRARARGASGWDWRAERHRLLGDPSREVQELDRPEGRR